MIGPLLTPLAHLAAGPLASIAVGPLAPAGGWPGPTVIRATGALLGWVPFLNPVKLPAGARLWMFLPLALCIAVVYRATRARSLKKLPRATLLTFVNITIGMIAIAVAFYLVDQAALHLLP
jgi:hypothetical protein